MKIKCEVCDCEFPPTIEKHYVSRDACKSDIATAFSNGEEKLFDTFDCPQCGCQVIVQERKRTFFVDTCFTEEDEEE